VMQELHRRAVRNFPGGPSNPSPRAQGAHPSSIQSPQRADLAEKGLADATPATARPEPRFRQQYWEQVPESRVLWRPRTPEGPESHTQMTHAQRASGSGSQNPRSGRPQFPERRPAQVRNLPVRTSASAHEWSRPSLMNSRVTKPAGATGLQSRFAILRRCAVRPQGAAQSTHTR